MRRHHLPPSCGLEMGVGWLRLADGCGMLCSDPDEESEEGGLWGGGSSDDGGAVSDDY